MKKIVCGVVVNLLLLAILVVAAFDCPVIEEPMKALNEVEICGLLLLAIFCWAEIQRPD